MLLKNNSSKVIGIKETSILPGATEECPKGYEKNPVVQRYIENGTFSVVEPNKKGRRPKPDTSGDTAGTSGGNGTSKNPDNAGDDTGPDGVPGKSEDKK